MKNLIYWEKEIEKKQIDAAMAYLSLIFDKKKLVTIGHKLNKASRSLTFHKASDLVRASGVVVTPGYQKDVAQQLQNIMLKNPLKPVILVSSSEKLYIADGYHRICACHSVNDDIEVASVRIEI